MLVLDVGVVAGRGRAKYCAEQEPIISRATTLLNEGGHTTKVVQKNGEPVASWMYTRVGPFLSFSTCDRYRPSQAARSVAIEIDLPSTPKQIPPKERLPTKLRLFETLPIKYCRFFDVDGIHSVYVEPLQPCSLQSVALFATAKRVRYASVWLSAFRAGKEQHTTHNCFPKMPFPDNSQKTID